MNEASNIQFTLALCHAQFNKTFLSLFRADYRKETVAPQTSILQATVCKHRRRPHHTIIITRPLKVYDCVVAQE